MNSVEQNNTKTFHCWAIVPAAGIGSRMQADRPKQYLQIAQQSLIEHTLERLLDTSWITAIVVAIAEDDEYWHELAVSKNSRIITVKGGSQRANSVSNALNYIKKNLAVQKESNNSSDKNTIENAPETTECEHFVLVHDAARPCLGKDDIEKLRKNLLTAKSGMLLADKISDTIKLADESASAPVISKTVPRDGLWRALTPQVFPLALLVEALSNVSNNSSTSMQITDEASAVEALGFKPLLIQGRSDNIKVTKPDDIELAELLLTNSIINKRLTKNSE